MSGIRTLVTCLLASVALALAACGGGDDSTSTASSTTSTSTETDISTETSDVVEGDCDPIEEVRVELGGTHFDRDFPADDYPTNPPTGGDHTPTPIVAGKFYPDPLRLGEAVHLLEHGAVIGWTNGLSAAEREAVEAEFNDIFQDGYYQLAVVENPELDVPFALSAWGAMQKCAQVDTTVIRPFVEEWYASPKTAEGGLACEGDARTLPNC
jgi:hypothetical protein